MAVHAVRAGGGPFEEPSFQGAVLFGDEIATTSAACDTRANVVRFVGDVLWPQEWPVGTQTEVCVPPPGHEPRPDAPGTFWSLPIIGVPRLEGDALVFTREDVEYWYEPITEAEYVSHFERDSFMDVDPLGELDRRRASSWDDLYSH